MRLAAAPFLLTLCLSPLAQAATLSVCTEASPEGANPDVPSLSKAAAEGCDKGCRTFKQP